MHLHVSGHRGLGWLEGLAPYKL